MEGFENGNAKAFEKRGIYQCFGRPQQQGELFGLGASNEEHVFLVLHGIVGMLQLVFPPGAMAYHHQFETFCVTSLEAVKSSQQGGQVFTTEDGADKDKVAIAAGVSCTG